MICRLASAAAARTAGPIDGVVDEPAEIAAYGPRAESPSVTVTCSSGMPSSSAAICAIAVFVPVPMSCIAVTTVDAAVGADSGPRVAGRAAAAVPDLRRHPDAALDGVGRTRAHLVAALPVRLGAAVALHQLLRAERDARRPGPCRRSFCAAARAGRCRASRRARPGAPRGRTCPRRTRARGTPSSAAG